MILTPECNGTDRALNRVGVELDATVMQEPREAVPAHQRVAKRVGELAAARPAAELLLEPDLQLFDKRLGERPPLGQAKRRRLAAYFFQLIRFVFEPDTRKPHEIERAFLEFGTLMLARETPDFEMLAMLRDEIEARLRPVLDCAIFQVSSNISLMPLPPRAPELNGQENIWPIHAPELAIQSSVARCDWAQVGHSI